MTEGALLPGAEPMSHRGSRAGVLLLHGFTGSPSSVRPIAERLVAAGYSVEVPLLPGHGTHIDDMLETGWSDWTDAAARALDRLAADTDRRAVVGLSMGGSLTLWLAARQCTGIVVEPRVEGVVCINPKVLPDPDEVREMVRDMVAEGDLVIPGSGNDIAKPGAIDVSYRGTPLPPALSLWDGLDELGLLLGSCDLPLLLMTSPDDHVVPSSESDHLAERWGGEVERRLLVNSFHVATLDHDAEVILAETLAFIDRILGPAG